MFPTYLATITVYNSCVCAHFFQGMGKTLVGRDSHFFNLQTNDARDICMTKIDDRINLKYI